MLPNRDSEDARPGGSSAVPLWQRAVVLILAACSAWAGEDPFLTTYTHLMEPAGNLELGLKNTIGKPGAGDRFLGTAAEFEYSFTNRWTTEFYLDWQATYAQSTFFTGYRWENRYRILPHEHWINPLLYVEFEDINTADRALLEVVGRDSKQDLKEPVRGGRRQTNRELEAKLILGSSYKGWTIAENLIAEKNLSHAPFEFGYSLGASRPLALSSRPDPCSLCFKNVQFGIEVYGGLGSHDDFGLHGTSQYIAPVLAWTLANGATFRISPGFGVTGASVPLLLRLGVSYGIDDFGPWLRRLVHGRGSAETMLNGGAAGPSAAITP